MHPDPHPVRRGPPGAPHLERRLLALARLARERPMDPDLPDRVLAALSLTARQSVGPRARGRRRAALALGVGAVLGLLLLPPGGGSRTRHAHAPLLGAPAPAASPELPTPRVAPRRMPATTERTR